MTVTLKPKTRKKPAPRRARRPKPVVVDKTHFIFVIDDSGSMLPYREIAQAAFNSVIVSAQQAAAAHKQATTASIYSFGERIDRIRGPVPVAQLEQISSYYPNQGFTHLWDAVRTALTEAQPLLDRQDTAIIVTVVTDGGHNPRIGVSTETIQSLKPLVDMAHATGRCTLTAQVPRGQERVMCLAGFSPDNVRAWAQTEQGIRELSHAQAEGFSGYMLSRSKGATATRRFFQTDASQIKARDLREMDDVRTDYSVWEVPAEEEIQVFCERKSRRPYRTGAAFYQLTKKEKNIQHYKGVLLLHRNTGAIYAGTQARELIGLPIDQDAQVEPGNHGDYEIFVQSTSVNRKLVRGTKVLYLKA
jgi:hypothetical protein